MNWQAFASGLVGALKLTATHELVRRRSSIAPRMDVLGERAIARTLKAVGQEPPADEQLHQMALTGDILANSLYYSLVGLGRPERAMLHGTLLGLAAGIGAVVLPGPLGLGEAPSNRTRTTQMMTISYYLLGGLAAGAAYRLLAKPSRPAYVSARDRYSEAVDTYQKDLVAF